MITSVGDQLVAMGVLKPEQLGEISAKSKELGLSWVKAVLKEKFVSDEKLAQALATVARVPVVEKIEEKMVSPEVLGKIPFRFLRENELLPITYQGKTAIAVLDPTQYQPIDELRILLAEPAQIIVCPARIIVDAVNRYYPLEGTKQMIEELGKEEFAEESIEFGEIDERDILGMAQEAPIIKMVNHILFQAVKLDASDIHIEPLEKEVNVRYRIDGVLHVAFNPPKRVQAALVSRIKIMANLNIAEKRKPQDGRIQIKVSDKAIDLRVSVLPTIFGEKIVMRLLDKSRSFVPVEDLNLSARDYAIVTQSIGLPNGIIMVTGPTGSGKTTTLYSILFRLNKPDVSIVTVEDPVEYQMNGITQVQVNEKAGLLFATALRSIVRQDPDIIMVGETRDQETAQIAVHASLTGHLVLTTLHTNSAPASITRLLDMGIEPFLIASSVTCIIAQRLVRKLCPACKQSYEPTVEMIKSLGLDAAAAKKIKFYKAVGCDECGGAGYHGRLALFEVMQMSPEIARLTLQSADAGALRAAAIKEGMTELLHDGVIKIGQGLTTIDEVLSAAASSQLID